MKKQLVIIGIVLLFVCVGLSGCSLQENDKLDLSDPNFKITSFTADDNCAAHPQLGTVWVNFTITNDGGEGYGAEYYVRLYQGIEGFKFCGNGHVYNETIPTFVVMGHHESKEYGVIFTGIDCTNGTDCFGYKEWFEYSKPQ